MSKKIRTRYAPSPTGYLHIGGARTALFSYLYAKHFHGEFIIRIEDTDLNRNIQDGEKSQLDNLAWLSIIADESPVNSNFKYGPYRQTERLSIYKEYIDMLVKKGLAYPCFCTPEELAQLKAEAGTLAVKYNQKCRNLTNEEISANQNNKKLKPVYRLKVPKNQKYAWNDIVRGPITFESSDIDDFVIARADYMPTYNFCVVIDDHLMDITHVFRGEEHISNTGKQLAIYEMLGWKAPEFAHLTIITNEQGQKLSKRDLSTVQFIEEFKNQGYLPETIVNFLAQLGWSANKKEEIFNLSELVRMFDTKQLSKSPTKFDIQKMQWMNNQYIKRMNDDDYLNYAKKFLLEKTLINLNLKNLDYLLLLYKKEISIFYQLNNLLLDFATNKICNSEIFKNVKNNFDKKSLELFTKMVTELSNWSEESIKFLIKDFGKITGLTGKELFMPIRMICTYQDHGPEIAKSIYIIGKDVILQRIKNFYA